MTPSVASSALVRAASASADSSGRLTSTNVVTHDSSCMATCVGLANRTLLPPFMPVGRNEDGSAPDVLDLFVAAGLAASKGAAKRLLEQGGLSVNGRKRSMADRAIARDELMTGGRALLKKGARDWAVVTVSE